MSATESTFVGKYIGGRYLVTAEAGAMEATIAAVHEEAHGILRRSSAFGAVLKTAEACFASRAGKESSFALHAMASRSRTSEEVHATYQSYRQAIAFGAGERVKGLLELHPSYRLYYEIGHELVGSETVAEIANAALDAIVRFCWSPVELEAIEIPIHDLGVLRSITPRSYPDERLRRLRKHWSHDLLRSLVDEMLGKSHATLREHFSQDPHVLADPVGAAFRRQIPETSLFIMTADFEVALNAESNRARLAQAMLVESMVMRGYDALVRRYQETDLAAMSSESLGPYLLKVDRALRTSPEVPEMTLLRSRPTQIHPIQTTQGTSSTVVFLRTSESFEKAFDTSALPFVIGPGHVVIYIPETSLEDVLASPERIDMQVGANASEDLIGLLGLLYRSRPMLVGIFASVVAMATEEDWMTLHMLARLDHQIWIIGDLPPRECARLVRPRMPEMRGFWRTSKNPNVGAMVCPQVGEAGILEGMILLGSKPSMVGLARSILMDELGDDFRGFGEGPLYFESAVRRQRAGSILADWLLATESVLNQ